MKKLFLGLSLCVCLCGCTNGRIYTEYESTEVEIEDTVGMIDFSEDLVWDKRTHIVYIACYTYMCEYVYVPYISENGNYMKWENNKLVEIIGE